MTDTTMVANPSFEAGTTEFDAPKNAPRRPSTLNTSKTATSSRALGRPFAKLATQSHPVAKGVEKWKSSHPRALWRCVQEDVRAGFAVEQRVWGVLALCGSVSILYAAYCFFFRP